MIQLSLPVTYVVMTLKSEWDSNVQFVPGSSSSVLMPVSSFGDSLSTDVRTSAVLARAVKVELLRVSPFLSSGGSLTKFVFST